MIGRFINADGYISTGQGILGNNMFAYCNNNSINCIDMTGCYPVSVVPVNFGIQNQIFINDASSKKIEENIAEEINDSYSKQEATEKINRILEPYSTNDAVCAVTFKDTEVEISNSINVNSKYDRLKISMIITRTDELTNRSAQSLAAEWYAHNVFYAISSDKAAIHVNLDYTKDRRWYMNVCTLIFDIMGWE